MAEPTRHEKEVLIFQLELKGKGTFTQTLELISNAQGSPHMVSLTATSVAGVVRSAVVN